MYCFIRYRLWIGSKDSLHWKKHFHLLNVDATISLCLTTWNTTSSPTEGTKSCNLQEVFPPGSVPSCKTIFDSKPQIASLTAELIYTQHPSFFLKEAVVFSNPRYWTYSSSSTTTFGEHKLLLGYFYIRALCISVSFRYGTQTGIKGDLY